MVAASYMTQTSKKPCLLFKLFTPLITQMHPFPTWDYLQAAHVEPGGNLEAHS